MNLTRLEVTTLLENKRALRCKNINENLWMKINDDNKRKRREKNVRIAFYGE